MVKWKCVLFLCLLFENNVGAKTHTNLRSDRQVQGTGCSCEEDKSKPPPMGYSIGNNNDGDNREHWHHEVDEETEDERCSSFTIPFCYGHGCCWDYAHNHCGSC